LLIFDRLVSSGVENCLLIFDRDWLVQVCRQIDEHSCDVC